MQSLASGTVVHNVQLSLKSAGGEMIPVLVSSAPLLDAGGHVLAVVVTLEDVREIRKMELAQLEIQQRQAFLLRMSDRLRSVADPVEIQSIAIRMLGTDLAADHAYYVEIGQDSQLIIRRGYHRPNAVPRIGAYGMDIVNQALATRLFAGETVGYPESAPGIHPE